MGEMKVLLFHPHLDVKGGSERLTKLMYKGLKENGVDVLLCSYAYDRDWFEEGEVIRDPGDLGRMVREQKPDWVFLAISESSYVSFLGDRVRTAMYVHFPLEEEVDEGSLGLYERKGRFLRTDLQSLLRIDRLFANSSLTAMAIRLVWGKEPVVVHPPLEPLFFEQPIKRTEVPYPRILYVTRFTPLKRPDFLILILPTIRKEVPEAELVLAGFPDPRHLHYFEQIVRLSEKVGGVQVVPSPSDQELLELYLNAKVFAHPRIGEHFGLSPCEAMACGTPVVIRGPTGLKDLGLASIAYSDWDFLQMLIKVLKADDEEWFGLSQEAQKVVKSLNYKDFSQKIIGGLA